MFSTSQDRLVKELRLAQINTIEEANEFLEKKFWDSFNAKFSQAAAKQEDAHETKQRPLFDLRIANYSGQEA